MQKPVESVLVKGINDVPNNLVIKEGILYKKYDGHIPIFDEKLEGCDVVVVNRKGYIKQLEQLKKLLEAKYIQDMNDELCLIA